MFDLGAFLSGDYVPPGVDVMTITPDVQSSSSSWSDSSSQQWHDSNFNTNTVKSSSTQYKAPPPPVVPQAPTIAQASNRYANQATVGAAMPGTGSAAGGYGASSGAGGRILSDAEFNDQLRAFMPAYNTANAQSRMQQLAANNQQRGWEYQMLADSLRPGWNVPQGQVAMSAGNQHVNQLMQYAAQGVRPNADLLATAQYYDDVWNQGGPVTKLPMITSGGQDWSTGYAAPQAPREVYGPQNQITGAGGNWGTAGGSDPAQWAHNYQGETSTGKYSYTPSQPSPYGNDNGYTPQAPGGWVHDNSIQGFTPQGQPIYSQPYGAQQMFDYGNSPVYDPNAGQHPEYNWQQSHYNDTGSLFKGPMNFDINQSLNNLQQGWSNAGKFVDDMGNIWSHAVPPAPSLEQMDASMHPYPNSFDPLASAWQVLQAAGGAAQRGAQAEMRRRYGFSNNNLSR